MQQSQPRQVEFQNEADFQQRTQNIERLLKTTQITLDEILKRMNQPIEKQVIEPQRVVEV